MPEFSLVSIALPIYNEAKSISRAIESWLAQDYPNFELIIVDNASNDGTAEICRQYAAKDKRICLVENPQNIGAYRNHKLAFELSRGAYFMWAGGHDHVHPSLISNAVKELNANQKLVMCTFRSEFRDEDDVCWRTTKGGLDLRNLPPHKRFTGMLQHLVGGGTANLFYGLYRREALSQVVEFKKSIGSDVILLTQVALLGEIVQLDDVLYYRFVPRDARKDGKRVKRHVAGVFGENSFELGAQMPNLGLLLGYSQAIDECNLPSPEKQYLFESIHAEAKRIQHILLKEFAEFITKGQNEILSLAKFPDAQKYRAVQFLHILNCARIFGMASEEAEQLYKDCEKIQLKSQAQISKRSDVTFLKYFSKRKGA